MSEKTASQRTEAASDPVAAETQITLHAWNFRGFKRVKIPLDGTIFLVGDNSSGKSSILHLISCILRHDLEGIPFLDDDLAVRYPRALLRCASSNYRKRCMPPQWLELFQPPQRRDTCDNLSCRRRSNIKCARAGPDPCAIHKALGGQ